MRRFPASSKSENRIMRAKFLPLFLCLGAVALKSADAPANFLLVLEKSQNNLVIIDPASLHILARVPVGNDPHEVVASDDGKIAYISNYERGTGKTIARVDLINQKALPPIDLGALSAPHGLAYAGGKLYFTAEGAKVVCRWDPATQKVDWVMGTGKNRTHMVLVSKDLRTVFTSDDGSATVSFIEQPSAPIAPLPGAGAAGASAAGARGPAPSLWNIDTVAVAPRSEGFDLSPDGKELWIANAQQSTISIIDVHERKIVQTIPSTKAANRIRFSPDGKYVLVPDTSGEELWVIDALTRKEYKRITLPGDSDGVVITPDGRYAYTTLSSRDGVGVIDLKSMTFLKEVKTGKGPDGLAWAGQK
jgi:DNA-binding beta-propeller fold protein YncE